MVAPAELGQLSETAIDREALKYKFLTGQGSFSQAHAHQLPADASRRTYTRLSQKNQSAILMDAPPPEDTARFVKVAEHLLGLGLSAPKIMAQDISSGFLILEDFGEDTFTNLIKKGEPLEPLYDLAVDTLIALHRRAKITDFPPFTVEMLTAEACALTLDYCPRKGIPLTGNILQDYTNRWSRVLRGALRGPSSLVLRDFHVDNLMRLPDREGVAQCGLLDFQDAVWGPVVFDLVSLVEDARLDLPPALVERCWSRYLAAFPEWDSAQLRQDGCILSAGRHAKIIGYFTRFAHEDGKRHYLSHIPRIWKLLQLCLENPALAEVKEWFEKNKVLPHDN